MQPSSPWKGSSSASEGQTEMQFCDSCIWPPADVHRNPQSQLFSFGLHMAKQLLSSHFQSCCRSSWGFRNTSESRCFHTLSGVASNLLSGMRADWLGPCQRFSCSVLCLPHDCQIALEFTVGAFRPSAAAPAAPTAILHPRQVTAQDKKQLQPVSQEASSTWEENCYANRLCTLILQNF